MCNFNEVGNVKVICIIDLRIDKVIVYGGEIKEFVFERLYDLLILR